MKNTQEKNARQLARHVLRQRTAIRMSASGSVKAKQQNRLRLIELYKSERALNDQQRVLAREYEEMWHETARDRDEFLVHAIAYLKASGVLNLQLAQVHENIRALHAAEAVAEPCPGTAELFVCGDLRNQTLFPVIESTNGTAAPVAAAMPRATAAATTKTPATATANDKARSDFATARRAKLTGLRPIFRKAVASIKHDKPSAIESSDDGSRVSGTDPIDERAQAEQGDPTLCVDRSTVFARICAHVAALCARPGAPRWLAQRTIALERVAEHGAHALESADLNALVLFQGQGGVAQLQRLFECKPAHLKFDPHCNGSTEPHCDISFLFEWFCETADILAFLKEMCACERCVQS